MYSTPTTMTKAEPSGKRVVRTVARNTAFMLGGQILIKVLAFIFSVYAVRQLGDVSFGRYSAALAYVAIFAMLTDLGMSVFSIREMAREKDSVTWLIPNVAALRAILSVVAILCIPLSAWLLGRTPDLVLGIFMGSCGLLLYALQGPLDGAMIAQERLDLSSLLNLGNQVVFIGLGFSLLGAGTGYHGLLLASLGGLLTRGLASFCVVKRLFGFELQPPDPRHWRSLLGSSLPFGVMGVVGSFAERFDTVLMSFVLTDAAVGWYNVPYHLVMMLMLLAQSMGVSVFPTLVKKYNSGVSIQSTVQRAMRYLFLMSLPMAVGATLLADRFIVLLYGQEFAPAIPVMRIMVWALPCLFLAEVLGYTITALHQEKKSMKLAIVKAAMIVTLNITLVPRLGMIGAAIVMVAGALFRVIYSSAIIGLAMLYEDTLKQLLRVVIAGALMGGVVWFLRDAPSLTALDDRLGLLMIVGVGVVVYGAAAVLLGAISAAEAGYVYGVGRQAVLKWRRAG